MFQLIGRTTISALLLLAWAGPAVGDPLLKYAWTVESNGREQVAGARTKVAFYPGDLARFRVSAERGSTALVLAAYDGKKLLTSRVVEVVDGQEGEVRWIWPDRGKDVKVFAVFLGPTDPQRASFQKLALKAGDGGPAATKLRQTISDWMSTELRRGGKSPESLGGVLMTSSQAARPVDDAPHPTNGHILPIQPSTPSKFPWRGLAQTLSLGPDEHRVVLYHLGSR